MRRTIGITFESNGGHGDERKFNKALFQIVIFRLAFGQSEPPPIIMDHDADVIRIIERRCAAIEGSIVKVPFRRSELPNELGKIMAVWWSSMVSGFHIALLSLCGQSFFGSGAVWIGAGALYGESSTAIAIRF